MLTLNLVWLDIVIVAQSCPSEKKKKCPKCADGRQAEIRQTIDKMMVKIR